MYAQGDPIETIGAVLFAASGCAPHGFCSMVRSLQKNETCLLCLSNGKRKVMPMTLAWCTALESV